MLSNKLKEAGFSFEEITSINQWRRDISEGKVYSHEDVMLHARKELFTHSKVNA